MIHQLVPSVPHGLWNQPCWPLSVVLIVCTHFFLLSRWFRTATRRGKNWCVIALPTAKLNCLLSFPHTNKSFFLPSFRPNAPLAFALVFLFSCLFSNYYLAWILKTESGGHVRIYVPFDLLVSRGNFSLSLPLSLSLPPRWLAIHRLDGQEPSAYLQTIMKKPMASPPMVRTNWTLFYWIPQNGTDRRRKKNGTQTKDFICTLPLDECMRTVFLMAFEHLTVSPRY